MEKHGPDSAVMGANAEEVTNEDPPDTANWSALNAREEDSANGAHERKSLGVERRTEESQCEAAKHWQGMDALAQLRIAADCDSQASSQSHVSGLQFNCSELLRVAREAAVTAREEEFCARDAKFDAMDGDLATCALDEASPISQLFVSMSTPVLSRGLPPAPLELSEPGGGGTGNERNGHSAELAAGMPPRAHTMHDETHAADGARTRSSGRGRGAKPKRRRHSASRNNFNAAGK